MPRSAVDAISPAFEHMKQILFRPYQWGIWWRVALLGIATGELSSGGSNFNGFNGRFPQPHHDKLAFATVPGPGMIAIIALVAALAFAFVIAMAYVGSVCRFILFDAVLTRHFSLTAGWRKWQAHGARYFGFNLVVMAVMFASIAVIIFPAILLAFRRVGHGSVGDHLAFLIAGGALLITILGSLILAVLLVSVLVKDFVIPQMALENIGVLEGWRRLWQWMKQDRGAYAGYIGMKVVLAIGAAVALGLVILVIVLFMLIPAVIAVMAVIALKPAGILGTAVVVTLTAIGATIAFVVLMFAMGFLGSPITIFFPAYSIHFFADRYPPLAAVLYPAPPAPETPPVPNVPSFEPPPMPPDVAPA